MQLKTNQNIEGFTLLEVLVVVVIVGVLAGITAPSLLGLINRNKLNGALTDVRGALTQVQRQAIKQGKSCSVTVGTSSVTSSTANCLLEERDYPSGVEVATNTTVEFNYKGETPTVVPGVTIVIQMADGSLADSKKCVTISGGIGLFRSGDYDGSSCITKDLN